MTLLKLEMVVFVIQTNQLGFGSFGEVNGMGGNAFLLPLICGPYMVNLNIGYIFIFILQASSLSTTFVARKQRLGWAALEKRQGGGSFSPYTTFLLSLSFY